MKRKSNRPIMDANHHFDADLQVKELDEQIKGFKEKAVKENDTIRRRTLKFHAEKLKLLREEAAFK